MTTLATELRNRLKDAVVAARDIAETGSRAALESLAVHHHEPYGHMSVEERSLRKKLRAHARQLGDRRDKNSGGQAIDRLVTECAYEHWHRMLFARYLAENHLLIEPESGVAISLEECEELAREEGLDPWALAGQYAQDMLPQIFRPDDPLLVVGLSREYRLKLEQQLAGLDTAVFTASDSLGWVYQFWQTRRKEEVNQSEVKIGADELPAVTQLFTEPYMVSFLIHNTLGAWCAHKKGDSDRMESEEDARQAAALPGVSWDYLRFVQDEDGGWTPAAGTFDKWPDRSCELKILDPCCGSGHFLVALFNHLVPLRMIEEGLSARMACDAVLAENLHGLELDERCTQIAAFALALAAWQYPDAGGYRKLPKLPVACSGLSVGAAREEWKQLGLNKKNLGLALAWMHDFFSQAPTLGSLLDPTASDSAKLIEWEELSQTLNEALTREQGEEAHEAGVAAQGLARAARMLAGRYHWVITNVPYLVRGKHGDVLKNFCERNYKEAKNDLATVFLERCLRLCKDGGATGIVLPQNWLFLTTYKKFRQKLLRKMTWRLVVRLGANAFQDMNYWAATTSLSILSREYPQKDNNIISLIDVSEDKQRDVKTEMLCGKRDCVFCRIPQSMQLAGPDSRIVFDTSALTSNPLLNKYATPNTGLQTGDNDKYSFKFWEVEAVDYPWTPYQRTAEVTCHHDGASQILRWEKNGSILRKQPGSALRGLDCVGRKGVLIHRMNKLPVTLYSGKIFDQNGAVVVTKDSNYLAAIWCYTSSEDYYANVRKLDEKVGVTPATLAKVPLNIEHWTKVGQEKYPHGLPKPYSADPPQWIFHGHPCGSVVWGEESKQLENGPLRTDETVLQVAVARILGYCWPAEMDPDMELATLQRDWTKKCNALLPLADEDGIVCIPSVRGEDTAQERLREMLAAAYGPNWSPARVQQLLAATGTNTADLDDWLRNHFFEAHCKLFKNRPFIWHIWDGRKRDGFHALGACPRISILFKIEVSQKNKHSHIRDIASIIFLKITKSLGIMHSRTGS